MSRSLRWMSALASVSLSLNTGCVSKPHQVLCRKDSDCEAEEICEPASGLCKPRAPTSQHPENGIAARFDCPFHIDPTSFSYLDDAAAAALKQEGIVPEGYVHSPPEARDTPENLALLAGKGFGLADLQFSIGSVSERLNATRTGCDLVLFLELVSKADQSEEVRAYLRMYLTAGEDPARPAAQVVLQVRADEADMSALPVPSRVQAQLYLPDSATGKLVVTALGAEGEMAITEGGDVRRVGDRLRGTFDIRFTDTPLNIRGQAPCRLPRDCSDGCAGLELTSLDCNRGECYPFDAAVGYCTSSCTENVDCELSADTLCYTAPEQVSGVCLTVCPTGTCDAGFACVREEGATTTPPSCVATCLFTGLEAHDYSDCVFGVPTGPGTTTGTTSPPAAPLGRTCDDAMPCPDGYMCYALDGANPGFCSKTCSDNAMCAEGYDKAGVPSCLMTDGDDFCVILCALEAGGDGTCPDGLMCSDRVNNDTGEAVPDGRPDLCADS